jgi:CPA2 family monovalent cation:H+ antiporter-2
VLALVLLPPLAAAWQPGGGDIDLWRPLATTLLSVGVFVALMLVAGRRLFPWVLWQVQRSGSRELFTLCVVAAAVSIAWGATMLFGVSFALGAFFAGMVLRESEFSHRAAEESLPLRDAFAVLFFVSVGMLFDPRVLLEQPLQVLGVVAVIVVGKSLAAAGLVLLMRYPLSTALTVATGLAQIGEFSFILVALGVNLGLMPMEGQSLVLAGALISIALNPLLFAANEPIRRWVLARSAYARELEHSDDPLAELPRDTDERYLSRQVVVVGHGRVGRPLVKALRAAHIPLVVAERQREQVEALREQSVAAVSGDAAEPEVLIQAHIARAGLLIITPRDLVAAQSALDTARTLNPGIHVMVLAANEEEAQRLRAQGVDVCLSVEEAQAEALARRVLQHVQGPGSATS